MGLCTECMADSNVSAPGRDGCECDSGYTYSSGSCVADSTSSGSSSDGANFLKVAMIALFCLLALLL